MGGQKKKSPGDFKVLKKKLGKKLKPANATSTSFQSKQLVIREQSVVADARAESTTSTRGLTVEQLAPQTRHHNSRVRREAFQQLYELAGDKCDASPVVHRAFVVVLEGLAEGMNDPDNDTRRAFHALFERICKRSGSPIINSQHLVTVINHVLATLTGAGLSRRLDATKVIQSLSETIYKDHIEQISYRLIPLYSDICRSVLGTTSSSLTKGVSSAGPAMSQKSGRILQTLKREAEVAKLSSKKKKIKTAENAVSAELSLVSDRLLQAAKAAKDLLSLNLPRDQVSPEDALNLIRAVLELLRHTKEAKNVDAMMLAGEALSLAVSKFPQVLDEQICLDLFSAFRQLPQFQLRRSSLVTSLACKQILEEGSKESGKIMEQWMNDNLSWFVKESQAQDLEVTVSLLEAVRGDKARTDTILEVFGSNFKSSLQRLSAQRTSTDLDDFRSKLNIFRKLALTLERSTRHDWIRPLPAALWSFAGGGKSVSGEEHNLLTSTMLSQEEEHVVGGGLELIRLCASLDDEAQEESKQLWNEVARSLSTFWCAFPKSSHTVLYGPYFRFSAGLRDTLISAVYVMPLTRLPSILLKAWAQAIVMGDDDNTLRKEFSLDARDVTLLIETSALFAMRKQDLDMATVEATLSFITTVGLFGKSSPVALNVACRMLKRLWHTMRWPLTALMAPVLLQAYEKLKELPSVWLQLAATAITCSPDNVINSSESNENSKADPELLSGSPTENELFRRINEVISEVWSRRGELHIPKDTYRALNGRITPCDIIRIADVTTKVAGEGKSTYADQVLMGWVEFLVENMDETHSTEVDLDGWTWKANPSLHAKVRQLAKEHKKLASSLKLLLLDQQ